MAAWGSATGTRAAAQADRTDIGDSVEFARRLRERAQTRADRFDAEEIERLGAAHPTGLPPDTAGQ